MRKLLSPLEMKRHRVYNLIYRGNNEAYARINGKRTILVTKRKPYFEFVELYSKSGLVRTPDLRSIPTMVENLALGFTEDDIFEPNDESQWFKHSLKVTSLDEGIEMGLLTEADIQNHPINSSRSPFVTYTNERRDFIGVSTEFDVEDKIPNNPYLQTVYIWWNTWKALENDFKKHGVDTRQ